MLRSNDYQMLLWLALALAAVAVIARGFWLYRASLTWPTAEGAITGLKVSGRGEPQPQLATISAQPLPTNFSTPMAIVSPEPGTRISPRKQKLATSPLANCPLAKQS